jgi:photosystem II stability/assembly factor-like uncharacterized protein
MINKFFFTIISIVFLSLTTILYCTHPIQAQEFQTSWEQIGQGGGGRFQAIAYSPVRNQFGHYTVYLGGDTFGVYKSNDNGASWIPKNNGLYEVSTSKIAVNPSNPNILFITTSGGLFKSTNAGDSWTGINYGRSFSTRSNNNSLASIAIDPNNTNTIFIGTGNFRTSQTSDNTTEIYKSTTGGRSGSWLRVYGTSEGYVVFDLAINPNNPNSIYASLAYRGNGKLLHSTNGGSTWSSIDSNPNHAYYELQFDDNNNLYATGWDGSVEPSGQCGVGGNPNSSAMRIVRISDNNPSNINIITPSVSSGPQSTCKLALGPGGELYIADSESWSSHSVWKCPSAADCQPNQWTPMKAMGDPGWASIYDLSQPTWVLGVSPDAGVWVGNDFRLHRWTNGKWEERYSQRVSGGFKTRGNSNTVIFSRKMLFVSANEYYWGPADIFIVGTKDGGQSYFRVTFPDYGAMNDARVLIADIQDSSIWYVFTQKQMQKQNHAVLFRKEGNGPWEEILTTCRSGSSCPFSNPTLPNAGGIIDIVADGNIIIASTYSGGVYRSTNSGGSWSNVLNAEVNMFTQSTINLNNIMAAAANGVWFSTDKGANWNHVRSSSPNYSVAYAGGNTWFSTQADRVYKTSNNGASWEQVYTWEKRSDIFNNRSPFSTDIAVGIVNPNNPIENPVCAAFTVMPYFDHSSIGGVACSLYGGGSGTWRQIELNGIAYNGWGVEFNPYDPNELFYLTYGSGIYKTHLSSSPPPLTSTPSF